MLRLTLSVDPDTVIEGPRALRALALRALGIPEQRLHGVRLIRRSVDARGGRPLSIALILEIEAEGEADLLQRRVKGLDPAPLPKAPLILPTLAHPPARRPVVVGMGPAGLFAALTLARAGVPPLLLDRGQPVERRSRDVESLMEGGPLDPQSNTLFGEGGAGTFSDGKLTSGIKDPLVAKVLRSFVDFGAPEEILTQAKPHIGTDRLRALLPRFRAALVEAGVEIRFGAQLADLRTEQGALRGILLHDGDGTAEIECDRLILAIGHSARDTLEMLESRGLPMAQKPFSLGLRIEHPQADIDRAQYGVYAGHPALGAAEYKLAVHLPGGRDVYTFCMCPGGSVVPAVSEAGHLNVNGMSRFARDQANANSALLVGVTPADFPGPEPLAGLNLQRRIEAAAFRLAGESYRAPAQLVADFLTGRPSGGPGAVFPSYRPGPTWTNLGEVLPDFVTEALRQALPELGRRMRGFDRPDAVLTGPETRSSSPVRLLREKDGQSIGISGLYPAGEGAGYAGGITSAAVDGIRAALAVLQTMEA